MKITLNKIVLAGGIDANENPINLRVSTRRETQSVKAIRAETIQTYDRGNSCTQLNFEVGRLHESQTKAIRHALLHPNDLTHAYGTLSIEFEKGKDNKTLQMDDATVRSVQIQCDGNASYTIYEIYGGKLHETQS